MKRFIVVVALAAVPLVFFAQKEDDGTIGGTNSIQDNSRASTRPFRTGTALPASCAFTLTVGGSTTGTREWFFKTDTQSLYFCTASGTWQQFAGISDHSQLSNLGFAASGHTGFASSTHAMTHRSGGSDPLASLTAVANGVPQGDAGGLISREWLPIFQGGTSGTKGAVPPPGPSDAANCLKGDGTWGDCGGGGSGSIMDYLSGKGDLITTDGLTPVNHPAGVSGQLLTIDPSATTGLRWSAASASFDPSFPLAVVHGATVEFSNDISYASGQSLSAVAVAGTTAPYVVGAIEFPDSALNCYNFMTTIPNAWNGQQVDMRFKVRNNSGHWGVASGGVCIPDTAHSNEQQCLKFSVQTAAIIEATSVKVPTMNAKVWTDVTAMRLSDNEFTSTARNLDMTGAQVRQRMLFQVCRDSRSTNPVCNESTVTGAGCDGVVGPVQLMQQTINWPIGITTQ